MKKSFNMATMPQRVNTAIKVIESVYDQADVIRLYLNNFEKIPSEFLDDKIEIHQGDDLKSTGKLFWAGNSDEYYFCIDDDLLYPPTYAEDMIKKLNEHNDDIVLSLHGKILKEGIKNSYFRDVKINLHCLGIVNRDIFVDVIGNGVSVFNTNKIKIDWASFKYLHMDDIMVSIAALKQGKKRLVMAHGSNYLKYLEPTGFTLFNKYANNDATQTEMVNSVDWNLK